MHLPDGQGVLMIPEGAIVTRTHKDYVWLRSDGQDRIAATETDIDHYIRTCSPIMIEAEK